MHDRTTCGFYVSEEVAGVGGGILMTAEWVTFLRIAIGTWPFLYL